VCFVDRSHITLLHEETLDQFVFATVDANLSLQTAYKYAFLFYVPGECPVSKVQGVSFVVFPSTEQLLQRKLATAGT
jgi:hypothetical protein